MPHNTMQNAEQKHVSEGQSNLKGSHIINTQSCYPGNPNEPRFTGQKSELQPTEKEGHQSLLTTAIILHLQFKNNPLKSY